MRLLGSRNVIGYVTIRLPGIDFLSVVHSDHASILHRYGEMAPQILDARAWTQKASIFGVDFGADLWSVCHRHYSSR